MSLLCIEFLEAGISPFVERPCVNRGHDRATGVLYVAAITESAVRSEVGNIVEHVRNPIFAGRQLKFPHSRRIHENATIWQEMKRTYRRRVTPFPVILANLASLQPPGPESVCQRGLPDA